MSMKKQKKSYMSLTTGEIVEGKMEIVKTAIHDLVYGRYLNIKWMEEEKAIQKLLKGEL